VRETFKIRDNTLIELTKKTDSIQTIRGRYGFISFFSADLLVGRSLQLYGEWAENEIAFLRRFIHPGDTVLDLGANIGTHTLAFAQAVGEEGRVIAFEPRPEIFAALEGTVGNNGLTNVALRQAALGAAEGSLIVPRLDVDLATNFGALSLVDAKEGPVSATPADMCSVPVMTVDGLELTACALIKIDVEGAEPAVLAGARGTIERLRPILYAECNSVESALAIKGFYDSVGYGALPPRLRRIQRAKFLRRGRKYLFGRARGRFARLSP
jgi:FkbM family methyltransferase